MKCKDDVCKLKKVSDFRHSFLSHLLNSYLESGNSYGGNKGFVLPPIRVLDFGVKYVGAE